MILVVNAWHGTLVAESIIINVFLRSHIKWLASYNSR